jgi:hypothetical protein
MLINMEREYEAKLKGPDTWIPSRRKSLDGRTLRTKYGSIDTFLAQLAVMPKPSNTTLSSEDCGRHVVVSVADSFAPPA